MNYRSDGVLRQPGWSTAKRELEHKERERMESVTLVSCAVSLAGPIWYSEINSKL
jgi:hypothetical protein